MPATRPIAVRTPIATSSHRRGISAAASGGPRTSRSTPSDERREQRGEEEHEPDHAEVGSAWT